MIIKNELEDKIKFKVNNSKYITLNHNEEYNCDVSGEAKIELINPDLSSIKRILKTILLMPIAIFIYMATVMFSEHSFIKYSSVYSVNCIDNNVYIIVVENDKGCILKKNDEVIDYIYQSKLKSAFLLILSILYSFLVYYFIVIIISKINPNILKNLMDFKNAF